MEEHYELAKWLAGEMDAQELKAFEETPEFATYSRIARLSADLITPELNQDQMLGAILQHSKKTQPKVIPFQKSIFIKIAAVLVVGLAIFFLSQPFSTENQYAANGKRSTFLLPDDSEVALNSGSQISYQKWQWKQNRVLELRGEAFFKVAKGKIFDVMTPLGKVSVVGTQFNVNIRNERFEVACFEGKVKVAVNNETTLLSKGDVLIYEKGIKIPTTPTTTDKPSWLNYEIVLQSVPLPEIIAELERQYNINIALKDIYSDAVFTGVLPANNLESALKILANTYQLQYQISKTTVILSPDA